MNISFEKFYHNSQKFHLQYWKGVWFVSSAIESAKVLCQLPKPLNESVFLILKITAMLVPTLRFSLKAYLKSNTQKAICLLPPSVSLAATNRLPSQH